MLNLINWVYPTMDTFVQWWREKGNFAHDKRRREGGCRGTGPVRIGRNWPEDGWRWRWKVLEGHCSKLVGTPWLHDGVFRTEVGTTIRHVPAGGYVIS